MVSDGDAKYNTQVEMSGWVNKFQSRMKSRQVRRYFKLNNEMLSNHPKLTGASTWEMSVSKAIVKVDEENCIVTIRLIDGEVRFQTETLAQARRWQDALQAASRCKLQDFYKLGRQLGEGSYGEVRLAYDLATGEKRAVKIVNRTNNAKELEFVQREINVLLSISHEHIVKTYDIFDERDRTYFVLEYVPNGDFFDYMLRARKLEENMARVVLWQTLEGLKYLHDNSIVHRDIKPENMLIASEKPMIIKLTDFGFANFLDPASATPQSELKSMVGTGCYMSPEILDARGHGKPVDLFATGVVMYRILSGKLPFAGMSLQDCYNHAMSGRIDFNNKWWRGISDSAKRLCAALLDPNPARRPTADEALNHSWFTDNASFRDENQASGRGKHRAEKAASMIAVPNTQNDGTSGPKSPGMRIAAWHVKSIPNFTGTADNISEHRER